MKYHKLILITLLPTFLIVSSLKGQDTKEELQGAFVELTEHEGWGPFSPRDGFKPKYYTGNFNVGGETYKIFQLKHQSDQYEERFIFHKVSSEFKFTEKEGGIVYHRFDEVNLKGITFDIHGYSKKAEQFVLIEKEKVDYVQRGLKPESIAPLFNKESLFNGPIALEDYQGKYVLLDFWGTWCRPCLEQTPFLIEAHKKFGDQIQFIGIAVDDKERVIKYLKEKNINWPQIFISIDKKNNSELVKEYNVYGYPAYFLISPSGKVIIGPEHENRLRGEALSETLQMVLSEN
jgi:thiol-disulfide isomerase/thioredoxin